MTNNRRKESKLNSYIRKTVFKNKKIFLAGFMMILLIFIVVNTICSVETIKNEKNIIDGHALYGDMQAFVYNISLEKAMKISKDSSIDRFEICQERYGSYSCKGHRCR